MYDNVPASQRVGDSHGKCAEAPMCSQIIRGVEKSTGSSIRNVDQAKKILKGTKMDIRNTTNKAGVNSPKKACDSCNSVQQNSGIVDVNKKDELIK